MGTTKAIRAAFWAAVLPALLCAGCIEQPPIAPPPPPPPPPSSPPVAPRPGQESNPPEELTSQVSFQIQCDVLSIDAPVGAVSGNAEIWARVREEAVGVRQSDHLTRNGIRVGVGRRGDLPAVEKIISGLRDVKVQRGLLQFSIRSAVEVYVQAEARQRRTWVISDDGRAAGDEWPACASILWVQAWHDIKQIDAVNLTLVPELRWGQARPDVYRPTLQRAGQYRDVGRLFEEVRINLAMGRGQFLLLAPNAEAQPVNVIGRAFYCDERMGQTREHVLLFRPRVVRAPNK
ncbi:MAG: hypothetical protein BIFFINMI_00026 [Phycisphaerae bacterium]|nr:hypothetical protein [Phycisphaerae bacterium]